MTLVVKRSGLKMWLMALGAIPLLIISLDVLTNRRITEWLTEIIFRPEDIQIYEPRDVIWAWVMAIFSGFIVLWGLKELFVPTKVVECRHEGLAFKLGGPFRPSSVVPWDELDDVSGGVVVDEEEEMKVLMVKVLTREHLPTHPWGARWVEPDKLAILAQDWSDDPDDIASQIIDYAVEVAKEDTRAERDRMLAELDRATLEEE